MFAKFLAICVLLAELHLLVYATFMAYLFSVWMADDTFANATTAQWWWEGGQRLLASMVMIALVAAVVHYINGILCRRRMILRNRQQMWISLLFLGIPMLAGLAGLVQFLLEKPFM